MDESGNCLNTIETYHIGDTTTLILDTTLPIPNANFGITKENDTCFIIGGQSDATTLISTI